MDHGDSLVVVESQLARLEGFEPPTRCLEGILGVYPLTSANVQKWRPYCVSDLP